MNAHVKGAHGPIEKVIQLSPLKYKENIKKVIPLSPLKPKENIQNDHDCNSKTDENHNYNWNTAIHEI